MKKIIIIIFSIILTAMICLYIIFFVFSNVIIEEKWPLIMGELKVYDINKTNNSIIFRILITRIQCPNPEVGIYADGVYDENLHNPDISKRRYELRLLNNEGVCIKRNIRHKYIDVQNDYKINTNDLIVIYNITQYPEYIVLFLIHGVEGKLVGKIPADPKDPSAAQWQARGMSCWEWFVEQMSKEKNLIDFDWEVYDSNYVPYTIEDPEAYGPGSGYYRDSAPPIDVNYAFSCVSCIEYAPPYLVSEGIPWNKQFTDFNTIYEIFIPTIDVSQITTVEVIG